MDSARWQLQGRRDKVEILRALGIELLREETLFYRIYSRITLFVLVYSFTMGEAYELYSQWGDLNAVVNVLNYLITHVTGAIKVTLLFFNRKKIGRIIKMLHNVPFKPNELRGGDVEKYYIRNIIRTTEIQKEASKASTKNTKEDVKKRHLIAKREPHRTAGTPKSHVSKSTKENIPSARNAHAISRSTPNIAASQGKAAAHAKRAENHSDERKWLKQIRPKAPDPSTAKGRMPKTTSVNHNNNEVGDGPMSAVDFSNITFRRGQVTKAEQGPGQEQGGEDLSRASSITNLNAEGKNKGALSKIRKSASKDRLDKIVDRKTEKKVLTKNNNKIEDDGSYSLESLQEIETLQKQLHEMATEKSNLALQLGEQKGQMHLLENEIINLKVIQDQLNQENSLLRNRLRDVSHSPLSDNEKQQLLLESHRHHNSAPASIATNLLDDGAGGDVTACPTPDWDKHSSSNVSEVSVACLQDKINQMQETHYSTNEELQATLQELTDLQRQLTDLQQDNERLAEEKTLMFDSLCRQTERLNDTRVEVDSLKQMLYRDKDDAAQLESVVEREQKFVDLLKSVQEEREGLLVKQEQLNNELLDANSAGIEQAGVIEQLRERVRTLECTLDAKNAEHKQLDQELTVTKDQSSGRQIEIDRLTDLLENARTKINELEQDRALSDKSELDELLDNARKEKDALESEVAHLKEQVARSRNDAEKLRDQISILQEKYKVTKNNAKCTQSELEYKCEKLLSDKSALAEQLQQLQEAANELQVQAQCQIEDKRQLSSVLSETQRNLSEAERKNAELENELVELKRLRKEEIEEWEKFQNDLLTSVRVANDFKTEAQQELQKMIMEDKAHRERLRQLEAQIDKLKVTSDSVAIRPNSFPVDDIATRRQKVALNRQKSVVKTLIETIENASKTSPKTVAGLGTLTKTGSNTSLNSLTSTPLTPVSPSKTSETVDSVSIKTPLREQQSNQQAKDWAKTTDLLVKNEMTKTNISNKSEDTICESIIQTTRGLDYSRRNSYSDLSEKDPLMALVKNGGSKRNALLRWCVTKTLGYRYIDITNFSSSWNDGLAFCALLHTYLPDKVPYDTLVPHEKRRNFSLAFAAAESVGISTTLNITEMIQVERPDWQQVISYVTAIYKHFET